MKSYNFFFFVYILIFIAIPKTFKIYTTKCINLFGIFYIDFYLKKFPFFYLIFIILDIVHWIYWFDEKNIIKFVY